MKPKPRQAGFTLLEMLVALVVFGLMMAGIAQSFHFGIQAFKATARRDSTPETLAAMDNALRDIVAHALPGSMTGQPGGLSFTTFLPPGAGTGGGLADAAIRMAPGGLLVLRYTPHPPGVPLAPPPPPRREILATGVRGVSLSYFATRENAPPAWSNSWSGKGLPLLIRLHLRLAGQSWPDLVMAPVAAGD
ncbi:type II secretion system protein [Acidocella sp.]|uniref:type II secretion system protein n=1 Tax=Acidocella sp. TaxID=50710 RepID=UPI003D029067